MPDNSCTTEKRDYKTIICSAKLFMGEDGLYLNRPALLSSSAVFYYNSLTKLFIVREEQTYETLIEIREAEITKLSSIEIYVEGTVNGQRQILGLTPIAT